METFDSNAEISTSRHGDRVHFNVKAHVSVWLAAIGVSVVDITSWVRMRGSLEYDPSSRKLSRIRGLDDMPWSELVLPACGVFAIVPYLLRRRMPSTDHERMQVIVDTPAAKAARLLTEMLTRETGWTILDMNPDTPAIRTPDSLESSRRHQIEKFSGELSSFSENQPRLPAFYRSRDADTSRRLTCASLKPSGVAGIIIGHGVAALIFGGRMYFMTGNFWPSVYFVGFMITLISFRHAGHRLWILSEIG